MSAYAIHRVNALAWDEIMSILYIGGSFHAIDNVTISSGLAMWSRHTGLIDFPGGGVLHSDGGVSNTQVKALAYEPRSEVRHTGRVFSLSNQLTPFNALCRIFGSHCSYRASFAESTIANATELPFGTGNICI